MLCTHTTHGWQDDLHELGQASTRQRGINELRMHQVAELTERQDATERALRTAERRTETVATLFADSFQRMQALGVASASAEVAAVLGHEALHVSQGGVALTSSAASAAPGPTDDDARVPEQQNAMQPTTEPQFSWQVESAVHGFIDFPRSYRTELSAAYLRRQRHVELKQQVAELWSVDSEELDPETKADWGPWLSVYGGVPVQVDLCEMLVLGRDKASDRALFGEWNGAMLPQLDKRAAALGHAVAAAALDAPAQDDTPTADERASVPTSSALRRVRVLTDYTPSIGSDRYVSLKAGEEFAVSRGQASDEWWYGFRPGVASKEFRFPRRFVELLPGHDVDEPTSSSKSTVDSADGGGCSTGASVSAASKLQGAAIVLGGGDAEHLATTREAVRELGTDLEKERQLQALRADAAQAERKHLANELAASRRSAEALEAALQAALGRIDELAARMECAEQALVSSEASAMEERLLELLAEREGARRKAAMERPRWEAIECRDAGQVAMRALDYVAAKALFRAALAQMEELSTAHERAQAPMQDSDAAARDLELTREIRQGLREATDKAVAESERRGVTLMARRPTAWYIRGDWGTGERAAEEERADREAAERAERKALAAETIAQVEKEILVAKQRQLVEEEEAAMMAKNREEAAAERLQAQKLLQQQKMEQAKRTARQA
jgi:hypothetical protein